MIASTSIVHLFNNTGCMTIEVDAIINWSLCCSPQIVISNYCTALVVVVFATFEDIIIVGRGMAELSPG
jgi:hypothetical protein